MNERQVMLETCKRGSRSGMRVDDAASFGLSDVDKTMHVCLSLEGLRSPSTTLPSMSTTTTSSTVISP